MAQFTLQRDTFDTGRVCLQSRGKTQTSILYSMYNDSATLFDVSLFGASFSSNGSGIDDGPIRAHKSVLVHASPHLLNLLTIDGLAYSKTVKYTIAEITHESLRDIVKFIYTDFVAMQEDGADKRICDILIGAKFLLMTDLADTCETFLANKDRLNAQNCLEVFQFAYKYNCNKLVEAACACIANNLLLVIRSTKFLKLSQEECAKILLSEPILAANNPDLRCRAAIAWLNYESPSRVASAECIMSMAAPDTVGVSPSTLLMAAKSVVVRPTIDEYTLSLIDAMTENNKRRREQRQLQVKLEVKQEQMENETFRGKAWYVVGNDASMNSEFHRYDVGLRRWSTLPNLPWTRSRAGVCAVGKTLIVMGGYKNSVPSAAIDEYDTVTQMWSVSKARLTSARGNMAVAADRDNKAYALGGVINLDNTISGFAAWYSVGAEKLNELPALNNRRHNSEAVCTRDNMLYVVGGFQATSSSNQIQTGFCNAVEKYDHKSKTWSITGKLKNLRGNLCAGFVGSDCLYITGGKSKLVEIFDAYTGQIHKGPELIRARFGCRALALDVNTICVLGGYGRDTVGEPLSSVEVCDVREGKWSIGCVVPDMPSGMARFGCARVL